MVYYIERHTSSGWNSFAKKATLHTMLLKAHRDGRLCWQYDKPFYKVKDAASCIGYIRRKVPSFTPYMRVADEYGTVLWTEGEGLTTPSAPSYPQEEPMEQTVTQPLHIPRDALIETLQGHLDDEKAKRQAAEDAKAANRELIAEQVRLFSDDELINMIDQNIHRAINALDFTQWVEKVREDKVWVSPEATPSAKESALEKTVRVLSLANDATIEVNATDDLYPLL